MTILLPNMLAFERKLETSDALMFAGNWGSEKDVDLDQDWKRPIRLSKRFNRSTQSSFGIEDAKKSQPNPVASENDDANLPSDKDTLKVSFSLRVIGGLGKPFACNDPNFESTILSKVREFKEDFGTGFEELAIRYAYNIANGRFLWRNRVCAEKIQINVRGTGLSEDLSFYADEYSLLDFEKNCDCQKLKELAALIGRGLSGSDEFVLIEVDAYVKLGKNQHVFPSQEMNMGEKKKVLFQLDGCAAIHNVKIGNALRTVDNWYENAEFPIAAEPFGAVTQRGQAYRKSTNDLYTLMVNWVNDKPIETCDKNYVLANLIRGGVFGGKGE